MKNIPSVHVHDAKFYVLAQSLSYNSPLHSIASIVKRAYRKLDTFEVKWCAPFCLVIHLLACKILLGAHGIDESCNVGSKKAECTFVFKL